MFKAVFSVTHTQLAEIRIHFTNKPYGKYSMWVGVCVFWFETSIALYYFSMFSDKNVCLFVWIYTLYLYFVKSLCLRASAATVARTQTHTHTNEWLNDDVNWEMRNGNTSWTEHTHTQRFGWAKQKWSGVEAHSQFNSELCLCGYGCIVCLSFSFSFSLALSLSLCTSGC